MFAKGSVEHLDIEKVVMDNFGELKIIHQERKNMGMTYVYIIENTPKPKHEQVLESEKSQTNKTNDAKEVDK